MNRSIRIIRAARGFVIGQVYGPEIDFGIRGTLVGCGRAEWVDSVAPAAAVTVERDERPRRQPARSR